MWVTTLAVFFFLFGSALHTLAQIDAIARASSVKQTRIEIFLSHWDTVLIRLAWAFAIFALWLRGELVAVLTAAKVTLPGWADGFLDLHVSGAVAFMAGYLFDSALAYIPGLKNSVPAALDSPEPNAPKG